MQTMEIVDKVNHTLKYFEERKEILFNRIQQLRQQLETLNHEIKEQEAYIELETHKEKLESNIFNLYDSSDEYAKRKKDLKNVLDKKVQKKKETEDALDFAEVELHVVKENIKSNQIVLEYISNDRADEMSEEKKDYFTESQKSNEEKVADMMSTNATESSSLNRTTPASDKHISKNENVSDKSDIAAQIRFCLEILEVDKQRCAIELNNLLEKM